MKALTLAATPLVFILATLSASLTGLAVTSDTRDVSFQDGFLVYEFWVSSLQAYLLDFSLSLTSYSPSGCILADRIPGTLQLHLNSPNATEGEAVMLADIYVYQACTNLSKPYEARVYNIRAKIVGNTTIIQLDIDFYSSKPIILYEPLCLSNLTIKYHYYNETYILIEIVLSELKTRGCSSRLADGVRILYLVDRLTWGTYILEDGSLIPVSPTPLAVPMIDPRAMLKIISHKLNETLDESVGSMNLSEYSGAISEYARQVAKSIFNIGYPPFTLVVVPRSDRDWDYMIFVTSNRLIYTSAEYISLHLKFNPEILDLLRDPEEAREVFLEPIREYLRSGDDEKLVEAILRYLSIESETEFVNLRTWPWHFDMPLTEHSWLISLTLPIPSSISEALSSPKARYMYIEAYTTTNNDKAEGSIRVIIDPRLIDQRLLDNWYLTSTCITYARETFKQLYEEYLLKAAQNESNDVYLNYIKDRINTYLRNCASRLNDIDFSPPHNNVERPQVNKESRVEPEPIVIYKEHPRESIPYKATNTSTSSTYHSDTYTQQINHNNYQINRTKLHIYATIAILTTILTSIVILLVRKQYNSS